MKGPAPLPPEIEAMIAVERVVAPASKELRTRAMARARDAMRRAAAPVPLSFWSRRASVLAAATLVMAFAMVAIAGFRSLHTRGPVGAPQRPTTVSEVPRSAPAPTVATQTVERQPASEPASPEAKKAAPARRRSSPDDAYTVELSILHRARAAVADGRFSTALDALAEHQRKFPAGKMREEREALRVKALAGFGRNEEARRAAESFRERYPDSVLSPRIEETVRPAP